MSVLCDKTIETLAIWVYLIFGTVLNDWVQSDQRLYINARRIVFHCEQELRVCDSKI